MTETATARRHRALAALEMPYVYTNTISCGTFVLAGHLDVDTLRRAFDALRREFPVLAGQIDNASELRLPTAEGEVPTPVFVVEQRPFAPGDVHLDLTPMKQLSGVLVVTDGDRHQVTLGVNHAVADGTHAAALLLRLWSLHTSGSTSRPTTPEQSRATEQPLPSSPRELALRLGITTRTGTTPTGFGSVRSNGVMPQATDLVGERLDFRRIVLDATTTSTIRRVATKASTRLHAMVCGVITAAERSVMTDIAGDVPVPMGIFSPVDLRSRVDPAVEDTEVTNFAGASRVTVDVTAASTPIEIGRTVHARLRRDIDDGSVFDDLFGDDNPAGDDLAPPIRISNIGTMPAPHLPDGLVALDFHTSSHVDMNIVRAMVATTPPGQPVPALMGVHYHVMGFRGRMSIEMRCVPGSVVPGALDRIASRITVLLGELADTGSDDAREDALDGR